MRVTYEIMSQKRHFFVKLVKGSFFTHKMDQLSVCCVVVSMFDFHCSDWGSNPGRGSKIS